MCRGFPTPHGLFGIESVLSVYSGCFLTSRLFPSLKINSGLKVSQSITLLAGYVQTFALTGRAGRKTRYEWTDTGVQVEQMHQGMTTE